MTEAHRSELITQPIPAPAIGWRLRTMLTSNRASVRKSTVITRDDIRRRTESGAHA